MPAARYPSRCGCRQSAQKFSMAMRRSTALLDVLLVVYGEGMGKIMWGTFYVALLLWRADMAPVVVCLILLRGALRDPIHTGSPYPNDIPVERDPVFFRNGPIYGGKLR